MRPLLRRTNRTWFPILAGVLIGIVVRLVLAALESPSFYRLTVWVFDETSPKLLFREPAYYCIHRTLLLGMAGIGGLVGIAFSKWSYTRCIVLLSGIVIVIAVFVTRRFH